MKIINILTVLGILAFSPTNACENCGCRSQSSNKASHTHSDNTTTNNIYAQKSNIQWKAAKIGGEHEGNIEIRSGHLHFENERLVSGKVEIDMASITCTDLEGSYKEQLEKHLNSGDFFDTKKHPISYIEILECDYKGYGKYNISSEITIKNITQKIQFIANVKNGIASANLVLDRSKFDVRYGSGSFFSDLGDNLIYDEFELKIKMIY
ncbi:MAG: lipid-binding protein [Flavobacteriales bacterium]|nr:lipid-binding protein [Flavobacteriales bacterium]|tara:strand:- start:5113 stop:5739 length:627 start_codon:yes stop_codon:yes gene_type:complete